MVSWFCARISTCGYLGFLVGLMAMKWERAKKMWNWLRNNNVSRLTEGLDGEIVKKSGHKPELQWWHEFRGIVKFGGEVIMMRSLAIVFGVACLPWFHPDAIVGVKWWWYAPWFHSGISSSVVLVPDELV